MNLHIRGGDSIFDKIGQDDIILAFFPCVRFENQILFWFQGNAKDLIKKGEIEKLEMDLKLHKELHDMYCLITKLAIVCLNKKIKLMIENPYGHDHYLKTYWAIKPKIIDFNRMQRGDYYKKPTQYWFFNFEPSNNLILEGINIKTQKLIKYSNKVNRSMISPDYANRFIREFLLEEN